MRVATLRGASAGELRAAIEDLYVCSDAVFASLDDAGWQGRHGRDWTMAEVPYHLAYFERELVVTGIERGAELPPEAHFLLSTMGEIDAWNGRMFAQRPRGQTGPQALEELRAVRARLRTLIAPMSDADLDAPVWTPMGGIGWRDRRYALAGAIMHNWSEHMQLLIRLSRSGPLPRPETTHLALDGFMRHFPMSITKSVASPFRVRFVFERPGGGAWLISAHDFACEVAEDTSTPADLTMTMTPRTWTLMWNQMTNPLLLMLTRRIKVSGLMKLGTFGRVFAPPGPNTPLTAGLVVL